MTSSDRIHLESNQEKIKWVAPKILFMEVDETAGKNPLHGEKIPMYNLGPS